MIFVNFVYDEKEINIFKDKKNFEDYIKNKNIIINNSDKLDRVNNVLDIRIFNWLLDNYCDYNYLCTLKNINMKDLMKLFINQKKHINNNTNYIKKAIEYTKYHIALNKLFTITLNKPYYYKLKEEITFNSDLMKRVYRNYKYDLDITKLEKNVNYSFINRIGRIFPKNHILQKIDRKKHINLFKADKNKRYFLIDFSNFYCTFLYLYLNDKKYISKTFYEDQAKKYNISRDLFKSNFLSWLNGAGKKSLGKFYNLFYVDFSDIVGLISNIRNGYFTNMFNHTMYYDKEYCKLGTFLQSSAEDWLIRFFYMLYKKFYNTTNIDFIYNLHDEFLVAVDKKYNISDLLSFVKIINYTIEEY